MTAAAALRLPGADTAPARLRPLLERATAGPLPGLLSSRSVVSDARSSAVLILLAGGTGGGGGAAGTDDLDVLITLRAATLSSHAGQPAFPGGRSEPGEDAVTTALREATEETGLDPAGVTPLLQLQDLHLDFSRHLVQPVVAHWHTPGPVAPVDPAETASVVRVPIRRLIDPANRGEIRLSGGHVGPAFAIDDLVIWGFTGILLDAVLELGGWNVPWSPGRELQPAPGDSARVQVNSRAPHHGRAPRHGRAHLDGRSER